LFELTPPVPEGPVDAALADEDDGRAAPPPGSTTIPLLPPFLCGEAVPPLSPRPALGESDPPPCLDDVFPIIRPSLEGTAWTPGRVEAAEVDLRQKVCHGQEVCPLS